MTESLQRAFDEISRLPKAEQDLFANWLLAEINSNERWIGLFARSQDALAKMAGNALDEHLRGDTRDLNMN